MRWIVGFLLISSALLKASELYLHPDSVLHNSLNRYVLPILVGTEIGVGMLAIAGVWWTRLRIGVFFLFAVFASFSLWLALRGAASCGCFGQLKIHPLITFVLDILVLVGLVWEYFTRGTRDASPRSHHDSPLATKLFICACVVLPFVAIVGLISYVSPQEDASDPAFRKLGGVLILEPENWIGKALPIQEYIDIDLSKGKWIVLMHRHECPKCQLAIPKYEQLAISNPKERIAFIEIPPYSDSQTPLSNKSLNGRLRDDLKWFIETPVEIQLANSVVTSASRKMPALTRSGMRSVDSKSGCESSITYLSI